MKPIKLHKPLINHINAVLMAVFEKGAAADKEVPTVLQANKQLGSKDRHFIAETVYDIVRWKRNYELAIVGYVNVVYNAFIYLSLLRRNIDVLNIEILELDKKIICIKSLKLNDRQSYPEWLDKKCITELGDNWEKIAIALNIPASVFIRINTLKISRNKMLELLNKENIISTIPNDFIQNNVAFKTPTCLEIISKNNLKNSHLYQQGLFEFQDIGSQIIGEFCDVDPNQKILDLCTGAGGKALQLSALLNNTGKIYATDFNANRMLQLAKRAKNAGCKNIEIIDFNLADAIRNIDVLLIDAPCSGLGTIRRNPGLKWKITAEAIEKYISIQADLLEKYKVVLAKNGKIIYATCSILPAENSAQIVRFIANNSDFYVEKEVTLLPTNYNGDGFYMASIKKR